jgi:S-layer protein (TIGR01567 family)
MQHNIKKLACLLAILLLGCCCPADAKSIEIRGTPGSVEAGSTMLLDGFNFPELIYRISDDLSYECLNISFAENGTINEDDASYTTKLYKNCQKREIMFMGSKYHSLDPDNADTLTKILKCFGSDDEKMMSIGDVWELDQDYTLTISGIDQNGDKATLELAKNSDVVEFTVIGEGDTFEYKTDVESTDDIILFTCKVDTVLRGTNSTIVVLKVVRHYSDTPLILETGDKFGDFKVTSITNDTIEMKNSKTISCSLDETIDLLDDWIKLEVSDKGYWGYVYSEEILECPEILEVSSVTESTDTGTTAQNTTASNTSDDTETNSTVAAVLPATSAATPIATSAVTTETEQPLMLAASGGAGIAPHALPAPGVALLVGLFAILALMMNIRRNEK